jgi:hypothetical protein
VIYSVDVDNSVKQGRGGNLIYISHRKGLAGHYGPGIRTPHTDFFNVHIIKCCHELNRLMCAIIDSLPGTTCSVAIICWWGRVEFGRLISEFMLIRVSVKQTAGVSAGAVARIFWPPSADRIHFHHKHSSSLFRSNSF